MIASTTGQSLLAEGAHSLKNLHSNVKVAAQHIATALVPGILIMIVASPWILAVFGRSYATAGTTPLRIFALASPFVAINYLADSITNARHQNRLFLSMNTFNSIGILVLSYFFVRWGLNGLAIAWLVAQGLTAGIYCIVFRSELRQFVEGRDATDSLGS
jgi:O-antigen/teichoic acid export membrane protein